MYINTFRYKPEDVDCKLCTEYRKKLGCTVKGCPFLADALEAGVVGYGDAVQNTLSRHTAPGYPSHRPNPALSGDHVGRCQA